MKRLADYIRELKSMRDRLFLLWCYLSNVEFELNDVIDEFMKMNDHRLEFLCRELERLILHIKAVKQEVELLERILRER